jgi:hypothetical protein
LSVYLCLLFFTSLDQYVSLVDRVGLDLLVKVEVGEALEDLLQGSLRDGVLVNAVGLLEVVNHTEHLADSLVLARYSQAHVVAVRFQELNGPEDFADSFDGAEKIALGEQLLSKDGSRTLDIFSLTANSLALRINYHALDGININGSSLFVGGHKFFLDFLHNQSSVFR